MPTNRSRPGGGGGGAAKINTSRFYVEWKGHQIEDLERFRDVTLQLRPNRPIIYLAGDSSLDNKFWVPSSGFGGEPLDVEVPEIYYHTLKRPQPKPDVAFWMNHFLGEGATCINTAIEASMLRERDDTLLPQDKFIRDNIREEDILIVSIGANDIALSPSPTTILHMIKLAWLTRQASLKDGTAWFFPYFQHLFGAKIQDYITQLIAKRKPRAVVVCIIYFPLEAQHGQESWANMQLKALGYDRWPGQLQAAIRAIYKMATKRIRVQGTMVVPCALFEVLDGKRKEEYTARVEPSTEGGRKMAQRFKELVDSILWV